MAKSQRKQKKPVEKPAQLFQPKDFLDLIAPAAVKFNTDSYAVSYTHLDVYKRQPPASRFPARSSESRPPPAVRWAWMG